MARETREERREENIENKGNIGNNENKEISLKTPIFDNCKLILYNLMMKKAEIDFRETISANKTILETTDLRLPHEWYPYARLQKRKIIYHGGPTNSGKTYQALQRLKNADPAKG